MKDPKRTIILTTTHVNQWPKAAENRQKKAIVLNTLEVQAESTVQAMGSSSGPLLSSGLEVWALDNGYVGIPVVESMAMAGANGIPAMIRFGSETSNLRGSGRGA